MYNDDLCDHHLLSDSVLKQGTFLLRRALFSVVSIQYRTSRIAVLWPSYSLLASELVHATNQYELCDGINI